MAPREGGGHRSRLELTALLAADPVARAAWSALSPAQQQEYHRWLAGAEEPTVRAARVARLRHRLLREH